LHIDPASVAGEPAWVVDQLKTNRREALVRAWKDREARLEAARADERAQEERAAALAGRAAKKKRRVEGGGGGDDDNNHNAELDEDDWFLDEPDGASGVSPSGVRGMMMVKENYTNDDDDQDANDDGLESPVKVTIRSPYRPFLPAYAL